MAISISKGESYMGKLRLWKIYALHQDWSHADALALELDPADTLYYRSLYSPISIKNQINTLIFSTQKNAESFITLSQLYLRLGDVQGAKNALLQAQKLDPIRDDIPTLLSTLN